MLLTILVIYLVGILLVGIWANKFNNNMADFLLAGRRLGVGLGSFALAATYFGGGLVIGLSQFAYEKGAIAWWNGISSMLGLVLVGFMAYKMRGFSLYTVPDFLMKRYGSNLIRLISSVLSLIALTGILAAQVTAASGILGMLGINSMTAAIIASLTFVVYTAIGGMWAATLTDFVQMIIVSVGIIMAGVLVWNQVGGWEGMATNITHVDPSAYFSLFGTGDLSFVVALTLPPILYSLIGQDLYQRLFATKSASAARNSAIIAGIILLVITIFPVIIGMGARVLYPNLENAATVLPTVMNEAMPEFVAGIVLAAIMAAIMSTANSLLTAGTSHIMNDLYIKTFKKESDVDGEDSKKLVRLSRIWTLILGGVAIFIAAFAPDIITLTLMSYTLYTAGVFVPVVGGLLWKRATPAGAIASLFAGILIAVLGISGVNLGGSSIDVLSSVFSLVVFVIVSLMTSPQRSALDEEKAPL
ncbi:sodium:solute symporter family protein [Brevibacillus centrosporus]|uniref:sodium:solute symporter family protein n=1 Tax=Brevibacillus centrosporus TaxID=54910 RepID=UPI002E1A0B73|nr:sodium:solute symporter family protein [Brevibacillus centrosporus]